MNAATKPQSDRLTVTDVAIRLKKRYHKARDLMLSGKLGKVEYNGRTMTVPLAGVIRYEQEEGKR